MNNYIKGIYNYCDRWCEKCAFTARCYSFAFEKKLTEATNENILDKDALWRLVQNFYSEMVPTEGDFDISDLIHFEDLPEFNINTDFQENNARNEEEENFLFKAAQSYACETHKWIETYADEANLQVLDNNKKEVLIDAVEIVQRYAFFISAKLLRALDIESIDEIPVNSDENGSAKIALIAISRSIAAWSVIRSFKIDQDSSAGLLGQLITLRRHVEQIFPRAMEFIRPGFDTE
jgi:hypothetical protein